jgi:TRAP-type C4-dicarboxylate transport system substrate-binding protein
VKTVMQTLAAAVLAVAMPLISSAAEYRWLSSWDNSYPAIPYVVDPFIKGIETASKGSITIVRNGPETVPPFEQLQPTAAGAFHFLFTHGAYHFGTTPYLAAVEAMGGDRDKRRAAGVSDMIDKHYQRYGLKLIAYTMTPNGGYQIFTRAPISANGDLQGRKIRGNATYQSVLTMLGASVVNLPPGELYSALDKGVVDGAAWPIHGLLDYKLNEVAKYLVRPAFGFTGYPIFMNLAAWNRLPDADRKILLDEGRKLEDRAHVEFGRLADEEEKIALSKAGMVITQMGPAQKAKLHQVWSDGLWDLAAQKSKKDIDELRAFARSKGLAN